MDGMDEDEWMGWGKRVALAQKAMFHAASWIVCGPEFVGDACHWIS